MSIQKDIISLTKSLVDLKELPRIQQIKLTIEELFDVEIQHHSLFFYGKKSVK